MFGKKRSAESRKKTSIAVSGKNHPLYGKRGKDSPNYGRKASVETCGNLRKANMGSKNPMFGRTGEKCPHYGKKRSAESIEKMRVAHTGKIPSAETRLKMRISHSGKTSSPETKLKQRLARIQQISKDKFNGNQVMPAWSSIACQKIDKYGKANGYNFQHAMNGGEHYIPELGYWTDGYDSNRNTIIEYYEKWHKYQVQKDLDRETEICNHLGCDFIILWE